MQDKFVFFCKKSDANGYLSNWYPSSFTINNVTYCCVEQYMMYQKALLMGDKDMADQIMKTDNPAVMKKLGRKIKKFDQQLWNQHKMKIVTDGCLAKFSQNTLLRNFLLSTGNKLIAEAASYDSIWGIGMSDNHHDVRNPAKWKGQNLLGKCLMSVRSSLSSSN